MSSVLYRHLLAGLLLGALGWATPAAAQVPAPATSAPATDATANAKRFVALCETKLQLAPEQTTALSTYLDQEVNYLSVLALNGLTPEVPAPLTTEPQQLEQVMGRMLSPTQLRQYRQLAQTQPAQGYLRSMALLPEEPASLAKGKQRQRRNSSMVAQRVDEVE